MSERVFLGLSGGVDSALSAALLRQDRIVPDDRKLPPACPDAVVQQSREVADRLRAEDDVDPGPGQDVGHCASDEQARDCRRREQREDAERLRQADLDGQGGELPQDHRQDRVQCRDHRGIYDISCFFHVFSFPCRGQNAHRDLVLFSGSLPGEDGLELTDPTEATIHDNIKHKKAQLFVSSPIRKLLSENINRIIFIFLNVYNSL